MRAAFAIYVVLLLIEGVLAWSVGSSPFLLAVWAVGLLGYVSVVRQSESAGEMVRAVAAGVLAVAGPLYYQAKAFPVLLCFLALAHFLAATQAVWEAVWGVQGRLTPSLRLRGAVFTIAFYATLGLAAMLLRPDRNPVPSAMAGTLALGVVLLAVPSWEASRLLRLRQAGPPSGALPGTAVLAWLSVVGLHLVLALLFVLLLPRAAQLLCRLSPKWDMRMSEMAESENGKEEESGPGSGGVEMRAGLDSSAATGLHRLPGKADIKASDLPRLYLKVTDPGARDRLRADGVVYVRSHTLDQYREQTWRAARGEGRWLEDSTDGKQDGWITLSPAAADSVAHEIFVLNSGGESLPALVGASAYRAKRLFVFPDGWCRMQLDGDVRFEALASPRIYGVPPVSIGSLAAAREHEEVHVDAGDDPVVEQLLAREDLLRDAPSTLEGRIDALQRWFREHIEYSTRVEGEAGRTALANFLIKERKGYCDFFATAGCLLLRAQGIPARVAYGYAGGMYDAVTGVYQFTDGMAHAWTEILLEEHGWVVCDFTPPVNIGGLGTAGAAANGSALQQEAFAALEAAAEAAVKEAAKKGGGVAGKITEAMGSGPDMVRSVESFRNLLPWVGLVTVLAFLWNAWRGRRTSAVKKNREARENRFADEHLQQPRYLKELVRIAAAAGHPRPKGSTVREYFRELARRGFLGTEFAPVLTYHYALRYEDQPEDRKAEKRFLAMVKALAAPAAGTGRAG